ncbi:MAG: XdhC family protein [Lachnospiraceae bacterium]|nr:XdhC family protein [Lachnospiraceae bacterium]
MKKLFQEIINLLEKGEDAVLVTITASSGSTPRGAGSRMLVKRDKTQMGTVGGGNVEYLAYQTALQAIREKASYTKGFSLTRSQTASIGMVCGGDVEVYFQYISPEDRNLLPLCRQIREALNRDADSWLILDITEETCWRMGLYTKKEGAAVPEDFFGAVDVQGREAELFLNRAVKREMDGRKYYIEPLVQAGTVYIFGGGHVAQELVPLLAHLDFRCVVMDDRPEFANPTVFPDAAQTVVGDLEHISNWISVKSCDYVCVMTRGHQFDYLVQKQMLTEKPCYIGIMGSRNKIQVVTQKLLEDGFSLEEIESCHMPIGTGILAETPAEIAVSIAGELIAVRAERMGRRKKDAGSKAR